MQSYENRRIVALTFGFPPLSGGISRHLYDLFYHLPPDKIKVIGLPFPGWQDFDEQQTFMVQRLRVPEEWTPFKRQMRFLPPLYLSALARDKQVDLILCGQAHYALMLPAWLIARIRRIPYAVFVYGTDMLRPQKLSYRRLFNELLRDASVIFADSQAAVDVAMSLGIMQDKIHVVNPSVGEFLLDSKISSESIRERYDLKDKRCILTVGRLVERKGHDVVIRALNTVLESIPNVHYLIVGSGIMEDSLKRLVAELSLQKHVTFVGYVPDDELSAYYQVCEVFAMISREIPEKGDLEGFGIVYLEANLLGKPVVAGSSGGVTDAVINEETGILVDPHSPDEVAAAIIRLLSTPELAKRLGETGRRRVMRDFRSAVIARRILKILAGVE
jgi:phosphatidylinositol alpha-1,6-mannosyltransferase